MAVRLSHYRSQRKGAWRQSGGRFTRLRGWLFGYDYFISYGQEPAATAYAEDLEKRLGWRGQLVFRDISGMAAGSHITEEIQRDLKRTRCLIVLATKKAAASPWVREEIRIFAPCKRCIVPVDLENLRPTQPWPELGGLLWKSDKRRWPTVHVVKEITRALKGWRAKGWTRLALFFLAVGALVGTAALYQAVVDTNAASQSLAEAAKERNEKQVQEEDAVKQQFQRYMDWICPDQRGAVFVPELPVFLEEDHALWGLAGIRPGRKEVRRRMLSFWLRAPDLLVKGLAHQAAGFRAALGISASRRAAFGKDALRITGQAVAAPSNPAWLNSLDVVMDAHGLASASGILAAVMQDPKTVNRDQLVLLARVLGKLAPHVPPATAEAIANRIADLLEDAKTSRQDLWDLANALARVTDAVTPDRANEPAARGFRAVVKAVTLPDFTQEAPPGSTDLLVRLARYVPSGEARGMNARVMTALETPKVSVSRLHALIPLFSALCLRSGNTPTIEEVADLANAMEESNDPGSWLELAEPFAAATGSLERTSAEQIVGPVAAAIVSLLEVPIRTDTLGLSKLALALGALSPRLNSEQAKVLADRLAKSMESSQDVERRVGLGLAMGELTRLFKADDFSDPVNRATNLLRPIVEDKEPLRINASKALGKFGSQLEAGQGGALAYRVVSVLRRLPWAFDLHAHLGLAVAALTKQLPPADRNALLSESALILLADIGAHSGNARELSAYDEIALLKLSLPLPNATQTRLFAFGSLLHNTSPFGHAVVLDEDRALVAEYLDTLSVPDLAAILKWPSCGFHWQPLLLSAIAIKAHLDFHGSLANFIVAADAGKVPGITREFLDAPVDFPSQDSAAAELRALQATYPPRELPR